MNYIKNKPNSNDGVVEAEITVTATSSPGITGMTTGAFIDRLYANGFIGNVGSNPNYPGVVWIGFNK